MKQMIKLESVNCWVGETGISPCDENGEPILSQVRLFENMPEDWYQNLTIEDKEKIATIISSK